MNSRSWRILVVDDDKQICELFSQTLQSKGYTPLMAYDGKTAMQEFRLGSPDLAILDLKLPDLNGLDLLRWAKALDKDIPVIIITGYAEIPGAVEAMRAAAYDYLPKPCHQDELIRVVRRALDERRFKLELKELAHQTDTNHELTAIMGPSDVIGRLITEINRVSNSSFSVIILGETGSGKEVVARAIHEASPRAKGPFIPVDCGAIPETILEDELFGHERGAFTGAVGSRRGKFELAKGGTLFLDEILNLPIGSQTKLLRALQEKIIYRLGGAIPVHVDARTLVAASLDLETAVAEGSFRVDLFFRLNEFTLRIPPLRERKEDIMYLAKRFLVLTNNELNKKVKGFTESAVNALHMYPWPGNVRQLRSTIRRAVLVADELVTEEHLDIACASGGIFPALQLPTKTRAVATDSPSLKAIVAQHIWAVEREAIAQALRQCQGNKAKATRLLQIDYKTMQSKVKKYGINPNQNNSYENEQRPK